MDAVTPKGEKQAGVEGHSHIVRPAEMEWRPTSFPGCEAKPLYVDAKNGIATLLMKFAASVYRGCVFSRLMMWILFRSPKMY